MNNRFNKNATIEITVHLLVWVILFYMPVALSNGTDMSMRDIAIHFWLQLVLFAVVFYLNYLLLIKKTLFVSKRKVLFFIANITLLILLTAIKYLIFQFIDKRPPSEHHGPPLKLIWYMDFMIYMIPLAFSIAIHSGKRMMKMEVYKAETENMKLQSELQHLKFQLQPHFFFNALNNIYALVETEPKKAQQSIHSLSKLMRYLLYASDASTISLAEELEFLRKYILLMQQRLNSMTDVEVSFAENIPNINIAPLLFISIVENAFKHGVSATNKTHIRFSLEIVDGTIQFSSVNSKVPKSGNDLSDSGIGLINLQKRLSLLYKENYTFQYNETDTEFNVLLAVPLNNPDL